MNKLHLILTVASIVSLSVRANAQTTTHPKPQQYYQDTSFTTYSATGQTTFGPSLSSIRLLLEQAQSQLSKDSLPKLELAKSDLEKSLQQLEQFVGDGTQNGELWNKFLRVPEIKQQLGAKNPSFLRLLDLETNMRQNYLGLEYPQFIRLRESLQNFAIAARFNNQEDRFIKFMDDSLESVIEATQASGSVDAELLQQLVTITGNLHQSKQAERQLQQLRGMFAAQNVRITVNESLVGRLAARPVSQPQGVDECILGTRILGTAYMNGNVSVNLLPMNNGVGLQLDLSACLSSRSRGYNRGVVLNATSSSPVLASKQVFVSEGGVSSSAATVSTQLNSTINSIEHRSRLVRRIARKKSAEQKPLADAIAEGRLQSRVQQQFSDQVDQQVSQAQPRLAELKQKQIPEIRRVGFVRPQLNLSSTSAEILAGTTIAEPFQLSATGGCPLPKPSNASVVGEVHESALCNGLATILAGRTIRNTSLGDYVKQITGKVPDDLKEEIEGEEWSITFNPTQPIRIALDDEMIAITVRLIRITRGKQPPLDEALSISTKYLPQLVGDQLILTRQGEVVVVSDKQTRGSVPAALRSFIRNKFDKTFRNSVTTEPLSPSLAKLQARMPQTSNLRLDIQRIVFRIDQGWLQVSVPL
jgi:chorismate mutase